MKKKSNSTSAKPNTHFDDGSQFLGCIMYADDLVLLCPSICRLKKMLDICVDEVTGLHLKLNTKKSCK